MVKPAWAQQRGALLGRAVSSVLKSPGVAEHWELHIRIIE